jgi:hypothetical protein
MPNPANRRTRLTAATAVCTVAPAVGLSACGTGNDSERDITELSVDVPDVVVTEQAHGQTEPWSRCA